MICRNAGTTTRFMIQDKIDKIFNVDVTVFNVTVSTHAMMTSSNGNIFRVTGHLCGEFTGLRSIPRTKASDAELSCFLWSVSKLTVEKTIVRLVIWNAIAPLWRQCNAGWPHMTMCTNSHPLSRFANPHIHTALRIMPVRPLVNDTHFVLDSEHSPLYGGISSSYVPLWLPPTCAILHVFIPTALT